MFQISKNFNKILLVPFFLKYLKLKRTLIFFKKFKNLKKHYFMSIIRSFLNHKNMFFFKKFFIYNKYLRILKRNTFINYSYSHYDIFAIISLWKLKFSSITFLNRIKNFFLNINLNKHNFFLSVKMLPENKKKKNNVYFRSNLINCIFFSFLEFLADKLIINFKKINKKFSNLLNSVKHNISFFNKEVFKRDYLHIKIVKILNTINLNFLKGPKKPKKRKSFLKKRKNFK